MSLRVATGLTDAVRESRVVQAVSTQVPDAVVVRRCRDVVELRAVAHASQVDVAVVDGALRGLDRDVVENLRHCGVRLVAVSDVDDDLLAMGVTAVVAESLVGLADCLRPSTAPAVKPSQGAFDVSASENPASGRLVAVWGPSGAPGRTTVAIELVAVLASQSLDAMIIDLDTIAPSVAQLLGLIDDTSGLAAAARVAARGEIEPAALAGMAVSVPSGPRVLVGLPSPERWTELRPASTAAVLECARSTVPWTVIDVGSILEGSDLDWVEPGTPPRFGAARTALAHADAVVCVGSPDPVGLTRLLREHWHVSSLAPTASQHWVLNLTRGRAATREARELIRDVAGRVPLEVPEDDKLVSVARAHGSPVAEFAPRSPFVESINVLAVDLASTLGSYDQTRDRTSRSHRRLLRGAHRRHRHRDAGVV